MDGVNGNLRTDRQWPDYRTVWRWHFYAGLICIPFVLWLAATGSIYLFKPQIDAWLDRPYQDLIDTTPAASPSRQVRAALEAFPGTRLNAYQLPANTHAAAQVLIGRGTELYRVYVHPRSLRILGSVSEDRRFTNLIFHLHGELLNGDAGSVIVETAASWALVMLLTGLYLWWPSGGGIGGVLYPRFGRNGRLLWRDLHAVIGFWSSFLVIFLLISGLPWAKSWGSMLHIAREWGSGTPLAQAWTTGRTSELAQRVQAITPPASSGEHAQMHHGVTLAPLEAASYDALDGIVPLVARAQLDSPVLIAPPSASETHWVARSDTQNRPRRVELRIDDATRTIASRMDFDDQPLIDRIVAVGVAAHEGQLFAPLNQLLGLVTAVSLWLICISALVMWWRRRPEHSLGAPPPQTQVRLARSMIALIALLGILLPLLGVTLLLVLIAERTCLRRLPRVGQFLGLRSAMSRGDHSNLAWHR